MNIGCFSLTWFWQPLWFFHRVSRFISTQSQGGCFFHGWRTSAGNPTRRSIQTINTDTKGKHTVTTKSPRALGERERLGPRRSTPVTVVSQPKSCFFHTPIFSSLTSRCRLLLRCDCVNNVLPQRPSSSVTESLSPFVVTCRPTRSKFPSYTGAV